MPHSDELLTGGLFAGRWQQSNSKKREYLRAAATLIEKKESATGKSIADLLGVTPKQLSVMRDSLIKDGTIFVDGQYLRFATPGMGKYIINVASQDGLQIASEFS
ncbi:MAG: hypothetical protein HKL80_12150 [Acidimicrobiales bacterium]|nr:hypothetical protein [Acidimicrobiales bacterium]